MVRLVIAACLLVAMVASLVAHGASATRSIDYIIATRHRPRPPTGPSVNLATVRKDCTGAHNNQHVKALVTAPDACTEEQYEATRALRGCFVLDDFKAMVKPHKEACLTRQARERQFRDLSLSMGAEEKKVEDLLNRSFIGEYMRAVGPFLPTFSRRSPVFLPGGTTGDNGKVFLKNLAKIAEASGDPSDILAAQQLDGYKDRAISLMKKFVELPCKEYVKKFTPFAQRTWAAVNVGVVGAISGKNTEAALVNECNVLHCAFRFAFCRNLLQYGAENLI